ncbi:MAG: GAF domain-containing protein [candidate division Zixibacteria bacterium]
MRVILAHKTLFTKAAITGIVITIASISLFVAFGRAMLEGPENYWTKEATEYFNHIDHAVYHYLEHHLDDASVDISKDLLRSENKLEILTKAGNSFSKSDQEQIVMWLLDDSDHSIMYSNRGDIIEASEISDIVGAFDKGPLTAFIQDEYYQFAVRSLDNIGLERIGKWTLVAAAKVENVYKAHDWNERIVGMEVYGGTDDNYSIVPEGVVAIPLRTYNDVEAGHIYINSSFQSFANEYLWGWQITLLSLLPILCVIFFIYLLFKYFSSFSDHSAMLSRLLKSDKPGVEIFRRDQHIMEKFMPELAELFSLAGESAAEKMYFKKSYEQIGMTLEVVEDKGFENRAMSDILEFLLRGLPDCGGAIFAAVESTLASTPIGKYNISDDLIHILEKTPRGHSFLKIASRLSSRSNLNEMQGIPTESDLAEIFSRYGSVYVFPLRFKGHLIGLLLLTSRESDLKTQFFSGLSDLLVELISVLTFGVLLEKDKLLRADGTRILQETSLAISSTLDLSSVLRIVAHRLTDYTDAAYCMILLKIQGSDEVEVASFFSKRREGVFAPSIDKLNLTELPGLAKAVNANRATVFEKHDIADFADEEKTFFNANSIESLTVLPIAHSAKFIGSIVLGEEMSGAKGAIGGDKLTIIQAISSQAASAIENARLYGFIKQKVDQLTASYNVSAIINSEINIDYMLSRVLDATREYFKFDYSVIYSADTKRGTLQPLAHRGFMPVSGEGQFKALSNSSVAGLVASIGEAVIVDDTRLDLNLKSSFPDAFSELAVPIKISEEVVGVFSVGSESKNSFTNLEEEFLQSLAAQIAVAIDKAKLFEQEKERAKRLKIIYEFSRQTSKSLNVNEVLELASASIREAFGCHLVFIMLRESESQNFYLAQRSSESSLKVSDKEFDFRDNNLLGRTVNAGRTLYCADTVETKDHFPGAKGLRSIVCVPVISAERIIGILGLGSTMPNEFSTEDINTVEAISDILAVAIEKSFLFRETTEKAERLSLLDKINTAISTSLDLDSFFNVVAKAVSDNAGYRWTLLVVPDGDSFSCKAGYSPKSLGDINPLPVLEILNDKLKKVFSTGAPEFVSFAELASIGKPENIQPIVDAGIRHLVLLPIGEADKCESALTVGSSRKEGFNPRELSLLHDIAIHLQIAWQNARLYEQLKTAYNQLQEAQDQVIQTEKLRALGEMSSGVVHDFNNILAAILGRVQLMLRKMGDAGDNQWLVFFEKNLSVIETAVKDGSSILSRISEFTKKKPTEAFENLLVHQIISDAVELTKPRWHNQSLATGKKINLIFENAGDLYVMGSPSELREVFTNLINNAVDALEKDGSIRISASITENNKIVISVEDSGYGMTEDTRKKIFEPFFTTKGKRGTGLGLSVTYGIINRHGGTIEVESLIGEGTKFKIFLPLSESGYVRQKTKEIPQIDFTTVTVLVVDDEESLRDILGEILESIGHKADIASCGEEALELLAKNKYDIVITDLGMENISGWDLADIINTDYPETKVILATGWGAHVEQGQLVLHRVEGLIKKPFKIGDISRIVDEVMSGSKNEVPIDKI